ncbi:hypothetical protein OWR29_32605 [Actinoplanes sp. Pm04-4]|uniref:Uncharacterized protein n=1 Tax=Paractinoplanes pyxinae TaxID=2997416 RepID=A0ABT4B8C1_9ACTN|nr:hypothetical protein [Actinoplanes pyxinae]MCY1142761.1 hypothetical protein [Actinoplanes pyxinae]
MRKLLQEFIGFVALVVGLGSGVAQLYGWPTGVGRFILAGLGSACLLYLIIRYSLLRYVRVGGKLRQELAAQQIAHQRYVEAIDRIIDQEGPIYAESLELTVTIGADDDGDTILERRRTTPKPRVTQRAIRPIVPYGNDRIIGLDDIGLKWALDRPNGGITPLPLRPTEKPRVWLVFDPGLTEPFTWQISYCSRGLWAPLRKRGYDHLVWNDRLPAGNGDNSVLSELTVRFVFPKSDKAPSVEELHRFGRIGSPEVREGGGWVIVWTDPSPEGRRYEWNLAQAL